MNAPSPSASRARFSRGAIGFLIVDLSCILLFVALGKENHGVTRGAGWFFNVWWPLAVGWFVGMLITSVYTRADRWPLRLVGTVAIAVIIGGPLRTLMDRPIYSIFTIIAFGFLSLVTVAWRVLRIAFRQARATPTT